MDDDLELTIKEVKRHFESTKLFDKNSVKT